MPGTLVLIGLNSPRISAGSFGLRSYISMWLGPPACQIRITDRRGELEDDWAARRRSKPGSVRPPRARLPTFRNERRLMPSQVREPRPMNSNIRISSLGIDRRLAGRWDRRLAGRSVSETGV